MESQQWPEVRPSARHWCAASELQQRRRSHGAESLSECADCLDTGCAASESQQLRRSDGAESVSECVDCLGTGCAAG